MAVWAIGDVQGCDDALAKLLDAIDFRSGRDVVWITGDLVNRGKRSADVLRRVRQLGASAKVVLGNHDLHLLGVVFSAASLRKQDTFSDVLQAPDRASLLDWLLARPLAVDDAARGVAMVHAGLPPQWTWDASLAHAREAELALQADPEHFLASLYGDEPSLWSDALQGMDRLRLIVNCFTRLRYIDARGALELECKEAPRQNRDAALQPWYERRDARWRERHVIFGHWSALGFHRDAYATCIDTGCAWGQSLTALRIDAADTEAEVIRIDCGGSPA